MISTLEEAKMRIKELEKENEELKAEVERLKARNLGGRKKHNEAWKSSYQEFAIKYDNGNCKGRSNQSQDSVSL